MIIILSKIIIKGYYIWKKNYEILLLEILFSAKYKKRVVKPKKGKGSFKRKKIKLV